MYVVMLHAIPEICFDSEYAGVVTIMVDCLGACGDMLAFILSRARASFTSQFPITHSPDQSRRNSEYVPD